MKKKIAVFDLDGTLIDAYHGFSRAFNCALENLGYPAVSEEVVKRAVGGGDRDLAEKFVKKEDVSRLLSMLRKDCMKFFTEGIRLLEGSEEMLSYLKQENLRIGIATNRRRFAVEPLLDELNIRQYFDIICTTDDVENPKPYPDMLIKVMNSCDARSKDDVFFVGDMDIDYYTGRNAGIDTYIVATGSSFRENLEKLEDIKLFDNLVTLKRYLETES